MLDILLVTEQSINVFIQVFPANPLSSWIFSTIYASPKLDKRLILWNELSSITPNPPSSWLLAGDFNEILAQDESLSCSPPNHRRLSIFNDFVNSCNLLNLGYNGPRFTWTNKRTFGLVMKRLDHVLSNPQWKLLYVETTILHLPRTSSDHHTLTLLPSTLVLTYSTWKQCSLTTLPSQTSSENLGMLTRMILLLPSWTSLYRSSLGTETRLATFFIGRKDFSPG